MPGYVVFSPYDGAPVPAANEQVRDELVNVYGHHLTPPELDGEAAEQEQSAADSSDQAEATPVGGQALEEHSQEQVFIGEDGPELIAPDHLGQVYPADGPP